MVPALMYHEITKNTTKNKYSITETEFRRQMDLIAREGYRGISVTDFYKGTNQNAIILTFDDGYASDRSIVMPILKQYGFSATFFVTTSYIGKDNQYLSWENISDLIGNGMDVQVHGHTHAFLDSNDSELICVEMLTPKTIFKQKINKEIEHFSFPGGRYSRHAIQYAKNSGYLSLSTSIPLLNDNRIATGLKLINRIVIHQHHDLVAFRKIVKGDVLYIYNNYIHYLLKNIIKKILGNILYQKIWEKKMR